MTIRADMIERYHFDLTIDLHGSIQIDDDALLNNIHEAIYKYDDKNLLLGGQKTDRGYSGLVGSSIGIEGRERLPDQVAEILATLKVPKHPFVKDYKAAEKQYKSCLDSLQRRISILENLQTKLGDAFDQISTASTREDLNIAVQGFQAEMESSKAAPAQ